MKGWREGCKARLVLRGPGQACTLYARACRRRGRPYTPCLSEMLARQALANVRLPQFNDLALVTRQATNP